MKRKEKIVAQSWDEAVDIARQYVRPIDIDVRGFGEFRFYPNGRAEPIGRTLRALREGFGGFR